MAERKPGTEVRQANAAKAGFTDEERAAMKERAKELKAEARATKNRADRESDVLAKIAEMPETGSRHGQAAPCDRQSQRARPLAENLVRDAGVCQGRQGRLLLQSAEKFKSRYATFGFSDEANLDEGAMWPTSFALKELTAADEARIGALVKKAVSWRT